MRDGKTLGRAMQALAFSLAYSCTPQVPTNSIPPRLPPPITSSWEEGACSFNENHLGYSSGAARAEIRLDVRIRDGEARRIYCSSDLTVIITRDSAVVSLGGEAVLSGRQSLGEIGNIFTFANSYSIDLRQINEEDGTRTSERVADGRLRVSTASGRQWSIDLFNPERWDIIRIDAVMDYR